MIVIAMTVALVAALAVAVASAHARNAAADVIATLGAVRDDQRHALVLAHVESTRSAGLRPSTGRA